MQVAIIGVQEQRTHEENTIIQRQYLSSNNTILVCDAKLDFHQPLLQSSVSHDPSEIINTVQKYGSVISSILYFLQESNTLLSSSFGQFV